MQTDLIKVPIFKEVNFGKIGTLVRLLMRRIGLGFRLKTIESLVISRIAVRVLHFMEIIKELFFSVRKVPCGLHLGLV